MTSIEEFKAWFKAYYIKHGFISSLKEAEEIWQAAYEAGRTAEREECAKVVEDIEARCIAKDVDDPPLEHVAQAIRARGKP